MGQLLFVLGLITIGRGAWGCIVADGELQGMIAANQGHMGSTPQWWLDAYEDAKKQIRKSVKIACLGVLTVIVGFVVMVLQ